MQTGRNTARPAVIGITGRGFADEWIQILACSIINAALLLFLRHISIQSTFQITVFGMVISRYVFSGLITQTQILVTAYLCVSTMKKGYIAAVFLNIASIVIACITIIFSENQNIFLLPGIVTYSGSIVISTIIYHYKKGLYENLILLTEQKEEITSLYEEITSSQEKLKQQNEQLIRYNKVVKENEKKLEQMAYYDVLTGLPNRKMINNKLNKLIRYCTKSKTSFSLVYTDLDNFKEINDLMGHQAGDAILKAVAERWKSCLNKKDVLGRLGGDEFAIVIRRELNRDEILEYVATFRDAMTDVFRHNMKEFNVRASFGVSIYPDDGNNTEDLLKHADMAMASVKHSGKNDIVFYCDEMQRNILERIQLEDGLKSAIANGEMSIAFQPQYCCKTQRIRGFEALARWHSASLGSANPSRFIPIAEETGLIIDIGEWILSNVLRKFRTANVSVMADYILTINISVIQILQPNFVDTVKRVLAETGFDSSRLELEITESVFISYPDKVIEALNQLKEMGIRIALDDFGTGYAALKYLQMLPIDTLKIDRTFVSRIGELESVNRIVGAIIALAHSLDIIVVAEGVESADQLNYLKKLGCDCMQGFLLGRPVEGDQFMQLAAMM